jgi:hypothetical protein
MGSVMPPLPVISGVQRVAFNWRVGTSGPTATNVMHFKGASTDTLALKNLLNTTITTNMWFGVAIGTGVYEVEITPLDGTSATVVYPVSGGGWNGSLTATQHSPATATVVSFKTATRGRRARGRIYIPFQDEQVMNGGITTSSVTAAQTAWDTFRTAMATGTYPLVVASYGHSLHKTKTSGGGFTMTPVTWTPDSYPVTSIQVETTFGTQRRRQSRLRV